MAQTREERNAKQRGRRRKDGNAITKKYEKTKRGFLMRLYRNMQSRVTGVQKLKAHLYDGKEILTRDEFYEWTLASKTFHELWAAWEAGDHPRRLTPSVDRIDSSLGYAIENMEWVPFHENCRRGAFSKWGKIEFRGEVIKV